MRRPLTVLIPCKDEDQNIASCVSSARLVADEVLIADSGSTDRTLEIAKSMPDCRLIEREFIGYADFKNWAIPQATHEWVLILDADERITPELAAEIKELLKSPPEHLYAYRILRRTFFLGHELKHGGMNTDDVCRLIRRDKCRYRQRRVHEEIDIEPHEWSRLKHPMVHYWIRSYDQYFEKFSRYTSLGAEEYLENGKRAGFAQLFVRPTVRFLQLYIFRLGCLDGLAGLQHCMLSSFYNTFVKQARLWEMQNSISQSDVESRLRTLAEEPGESSETTAQLSVVPFPEKAKVGISKLAS